MENAQVVMDFMNFLSNNKDIIQSFVKTCPDCSYTMNISMNECSNCIWKFPIHFLNQK
jgi:adenosine/AMP kinase